LDPLGEFIRRGPGTVPPRRIGSRAEPLFRESLKLRRASLAAGHPDIATALDNLANLLAQLLSSTGRDDDAGAVLIEQADSCRSPSVKGRSPLCNALVKLAAFQLKRNQFTAAEKTCREELALFRQAVPIDELNVAQGSSGLGRALLGEAKTAEAEPLLRQALEIRTRRLGASQPATAMTADALARLLDDTGRAAEAKAVRSQHVVTAGKSVGTSQPTTAP
jgi:tetratricopeptide (TPR) repeat protein